MLLKYINTTAISTSFVSVAKKVLPVILPLNLNDSESVTAGFNHLYNINFFSYAVSELVHNKDVVSLFPSSAHHLHRLQ